jgi:hypothetical protein
MNMNDTNAAMRKIVQKYFTVPDDIEMVSGIEAQNEAWRMGWNAALDKVRDELLWAESYDNPDNIVMRLKIEDI